MALQERKRPYEFLARINPDGSVPCHVQYIEEVVKDGVVIHARTLPAVSLHEAPEGVAQITRRFNDALVADRDAWREKAERLESELQMLRSEHAQVTTQRDKALSRLKQIAEED